MKLWEIGNELRAIEVAIIEADGEITPEIERRLEAAEGDFDLKVQNIALLIKEHAGLADAAFTEEVRIKAIRVSHQRAVEGLKRYTQMVMQRANVPRVDTPVARVRVQRNSQPSVTWTGSPDDLPERYQKIEVGVNKKNVLYDWQNSGEDEADRTVPDGFRIEWGHHLRIQ